MSSLNFKVLWNFLIRLCGFLRRHKYHVIAVILIGAWCYPYITTGNKVEWGDFGIFTQGYEAIRVSILQYHQFPWFDPWIAGGVPLYANPQIGVFSIQTILVLIFGAVRGLKVALILYTYAGYASMYILARRYFKIDKLPATLLGLIWLFCSFFVSHLPSHYTFLWFMMAPFFIYLALRLNSLKSGFWFGLAFAVMGLSDVHYSFFQIVIVCSLIILARLIIDNRHRLQIFKAGIVALLTFFLVAGHRFLLTIENVNDFPRTAAQLFDPSSGLIKSLLSVTLPYSTAHYVKLTRLIHYPTTFYGWGEQTMTIGIFASFCLFLCFLYYLYSWHSKQSQQRKYRRIATLLLALALVFFVMGIGSFSAFAPYTILRHLPVFNNTRVSPRWFLWVGLSCLIFVGVSIKSAPRQSFFRFASVGLLVLGVGELFLLNLGYQSKILSHAVVLPPHNTSYYTFEQESEFGQFLTLPGGKGTIPNEGNMPHFYREYEATAFNLGTLQANDSLVDLNTKPTPRCSWVNGCNFVMSNNAIVSYWSPNKIILHRTGSGPIELDENNSNYFLINGVRNNVIRVDEPYANFYIKLPNNIKTITVRVDPSLTLPRIKHIVRGIMHD